MKEKGIIALLLILVVRFIKWPIIITIREGSPAKFNMPGGFVAWILVMVVLGVLLKVIEFKDEKGKLNGFWLMTLPLFILSIGLIRQGMLFSISKIPCIILAAVGFVLVISKNGKRNSKNGIAVMLLGIVFSFTMPNFINTIDNSTDAIWHVLMILSLLTIMKNELSCWDKTSEHKQSVLKNMICNSTCIVGIILDFLFWNLNGAADSYFWSFVFDVIIASGLASYWPKIVSKVNGK